MLSTLVAFFIFSVDAPASLNQSTKRTQTELRVDVKRKKTATSWRVFTSAFNHTPRHFVVNFSSVLRSSLIATQVQFKHEHAQYVESRQTPHLITHSARHAEDLPAVA